RSNTLQFVELGRPFQFSADTRVLRINRGTPSSCIFLVDELRYGDFREVRIAQELGAVVEGATERFGRQMDCFCRTISEFRQIVSFQNIQDFDQRDSTGGWGWSANNLVISVRSGDRLAFLHFVLSKIVSGDQPAPLLD